MKKLLAVVAVVAFCASFTSCKKECECKVGPVTMDLSAAGIDTKEECDAYAELSKDTPGINCSWK